MSAGESCRARGHGSLSALAAEVARDIDRSLAASSRYGQGPGGRARRLSALLRPGVLAVLLHRISHHLLAAGFPGLARPFAALNHVLHKVSIPPRSCVLGGFHLPHPPGIHFDADAGADLTLYSQCCCGPLPGAPSGRPRLGNGVVIGVHAAVSGGITVGDGACVAFGTAVAEDIPGGATAVSPAARARPPSGRHS